MRRNSSTVVVVAGQVPGQVPGEVLAAASRSMNVTLYRPEPPAGTGDDPLAASAGALRNAGRATSPYALVPADPLAAVAARWREMWDLSVQPGPAAFEAEAAQALAAWRAGRFELPDYYLILAAEASPPGGPPGGPSGGPVGDDATPVPDFYLGPLRSARPHRVVLVPATEPAQQAEGVLRALGSLRHGPWWPDLDQLIETARRFYPAGLSEANSTTPAISLDRAG
jgi:hypothetical protein